MKKVMFAAAVAAGLVAFGDGIESANTVGYQQIELTSKNTIVGINFLGTDGNAMALNDAVPYVTGMTKGANANDADQIQIQTSTGGYTTYYMSNGKNAKGTAVTGLEGKWAKGGTYVPTTDSIPAGKGAWFCRKGSDNFQITVARPFEL